MRPSYDFIIVGAGSAGCIIASRLSEDPATSVLLVEAGPEPRSPWMGMPAGIGRLLFPGPYNWGYSTEPEPQLQGREIYVPRGRTVGGSSAINGMVYMRGHPEDYELWRQSGNVGWGWEDVLPFFRRSEHFVAGESDIHGRDGELWVTEASTIHAATRDFIKAGVRLGLPLRTDLNHPEQEGVGPLHFTIRNGRRHSSADAFLSSARHRANLKIAAGTLVDRVVFEGRRATGIVVRKNGVENRVAANAEVILTAGAINTPQLLMRSGVGPAAHLAQFGIGVIVDRPEVGRNLQDHLYTNLTFKVDEDSSLNAQLRGINQFRHGLHYLTRRRGILATSPAQAGAFVRSLPGAARPDVQITFRAVSWEFDKGGTLVVGRDPAVTSSHCFLQPRSRGHIELRSAEPNTPPKIFANYLDDCIDRSATVAGVQWIRRIFSTEPLKSRITIESLPGPSIMTGHDILEYARQTAQSMHHWAGTCRMGPDPAAIVDNHLRVRGLSGLRIADASIMPLLPSGNTNAPTMMIAERAADLIRTMARSAERCDADIV